VTSGRDTSSGSLEETTSRVSCGRRLDKFDDLVCLES
jgi:hypothetical protein